ncbi:MAG: 30S ribosomal protein S8 [Planctomycetes bacterium]|jgi:small subunit ribosomal protein S8|nr:30S ribosomal protein S8 [Planctomycetota bacterium]
MMTDSIADMLTRIRNANRIESPAVDIPCTKVKITIAQVLKDEGFVLDFQVGKPVHAPDGRNTFQTEVEMNDPKKVLRVFLKYGPDGERVIRRIQRASKPGRRLYCSYKELKPVLQGMGISIVSTSRGVMSDRKARAERLGGELLCYVW